jgi:tryptophan 2,3-dioxygenase
MANRTYGEILRLDELLDMQERIADVPDTLFFITIHQIYELWFMIMLHELEHARAHLFDDEIREARHHLARVHAVERVLVQQVDTLDTIDPAGFLAIRDQLHNTSGFQSAQFREIEFLSGLKDASYLDSVEVQPSERGRLQRRLEEPTLWDAFRSVHDCHGRPDLVALMRTGGGDHELLDLVDALLDHDQGFSLWRARHVQMVERQIGHKPGTGGSTGVGYLRATLDKRFYPELWAMRSQL